MSIDLSINAVYAPLRWALPDAVSAFQQLLQALSQTPFCEDTWWVETPRGEGDDARLDALGQVSDLVAWFEEREAMIFDGEDRVGPRTVYASGGAETARRYKLQLSWDAQFGQSGLTFDIFAPHPQRGLTAALMRDVCAAIIDWQRPMHINGMPTRYRAEYHPLDVARLGVGWLGWVPFEVARGNLPEAEIINAMSWGTFVASQADYWAASGPQKNADAIARAQALDLRLNQLGVLPTSVELERGDWGR
ncbi:hypothetical protein SAMN05444273_102439 [Litoreibacter ascidiaceicola]|uniref:Immunity protein 52 n=1 Tax=Litoreibacter ascidiaceicola TaxID=1486859 RepID=A0A1M4VZR1_9RHOB|nr:hypothetical protein [Litoreibacter ascidiaceicola]SHE74439.1 hypothetical protein SAMN05444273_102439 [Litoreibacter ascidiaceicola]